MPQQQYGPATKLKARLLRKNDGLSYKEIADKIGIAKSTAKLWCDDIVLKPEYRQRLYTKQIEILSKGPKSSHERREKEVKVIIKNAENEIHLPLDNEAYKLLGAALYWAEGDKTKHFAITNSDPSLIKFMVVWMHDILEIESQRLKAHLNIYPQQNEKEIKNFWSDLTGIPLKNFGKSFVKPANKKYKKNTLYYGTIKVRVSRGTDTKYRVFGWINSALKNTKTEIAKIERKWHKLKTDYNRP